MDRGEARRDGTIDYLRIAPLCSTAISTASKCHAVEGLRLKVCNRRSPWWDREPYEGESRLELSRKCIFQAVEQSRICRLADTKTCQCQR